MSEWNPTIGGREIPISDQVRTEIMRANRKYCDENNLPYMPQLQNWLAEHPEENRPTHAQRVTLMGQARQAAMDNDWDAVRDYLDQLGVTSVEEAVAHGTLRSLAEERVAHLNTLIVEELRREMETP